MQQLKSTGIVSTAIAVISSLPAVLGQEGRLGLEVQQEQAELVERAPLVIRVVVRNLGGAPIMTVHSGEGLSALVRYAELVLTQGERVYRVSYTGGPSPNTPLPPFDSPLAPGEAIEVERVFSLVVQAPPPPRWAGDLRELYQFVSPGTYTAHVELAVGRGEKLASPDFALTVLEAQGIDAEARDRVEFRHVDFLEGHDRPLDESDYDGRKWHGKVDVSRFGELQKILDHYPESTYAEWIRFWKLYHHGPWDEALQYAREHRDFPLSDKLMLRVGEKLFGEKEFDRSREVVGELLRDFPEGDTRQRALELQARLANKP